MGFQIVRQHISYEGDIPFQFPLWDSFGGIPYENAEFTIFQFPLWDSVKFEFDILKPTLLSIPFMGFLIKYERTSKSA